MRTVEFNEATLARLVFGTDERVPESQPVAAGRMTAAIVPGAIRDICFDGIEIVRAIDCPIRDEDWGTSPTGDLTASHAVDGGGQRFAFSYSALAGRLSCEVSFFVSNNDYVEASFAATALKSVTVTRAGIVVLHPILGLAGASLEVTHSDGSLERTHFPRLIKPSQPAFDITGLVYQIEHATTRIRFEGEVFEMEDQRNWSDASFKTYCRPLARPCPFEIAEGETIHQRVRIEARHSDIRMASAIAGPRGRDAGRIPEILLAVEDGWWPSSGGTDLVGPLGCDRVLARIENPEECGTGWLLESTEGRAADIEVVIPENTEPSDCLSTVAGALRAAGIAAAHVTALPAPYLKSYQPDGVWPGGASPADAATAAAANFPTAKIGTGMLSNFTELNRCRPGPDLGDFVTHGSTAIVHAADDRSVFQTLEALPAVFETARSFAGSRGYRLGLSSIGARTNPYGKSVTPNPDLVRRPLARSDPRQRSLLGAAFAVATASLAARARVDAIALAAPVGPFGVAERVGDQWLAYPVFHAVRALNAVAGLGLVRLDVPDGVYGVSCDRDGLPIAIIANCSFEVRDVALPGDATFLKLGAEQARGAACSMHWLDSTPQRGSHLRLRPCEIAFVNVSTGVQS